MPLQKKPPVFPRLPKLKRPLRSKAAIAERKLPPEWFYLSFASDSAFLGATIVWAHGEVTAVEQAASLGVAPGGEVMCWAVGKKHLHKITLDLANRLLSESDMINKLHAKRNNE